VTGDAALGTGVRFWRLRRGYSQAELSARAGVSITVIRKLEQECGDSVGSPGVRLASLYALARALQVQTAQLFPSAGPEPADRDPAHLALLPVRVALTPPLTAAGADPGPPGRRDDPGPARLAAGCARMYDADRYDTLAAQLPHLLRQARPVLGQRDAGEQDRDGQRAAAAAFELAGWFLAQVGAGDLAYQAVSDVLAAGAARADPVTAAACTACECWVFIRQGRLLDAKRTATEAADLIEPPRIRDASQAELAAWGWLLLMAWSAAVRNNQEDEAREFLRCAGTAGAATRGDRIDWDRYWLTLGPATVAAKQVEHEVLTGNYQQALDLAGRLPAGTMRADCRQRHLLDLAAAHAGVGNREEAIGILTGLRTAAPRWLRHQRAGRSTARALVRAPVRALSEDARALADFYDFGA
jgi:transcriptional regulator with XRE-family HTH domain